MHGPFTSGPSPVDQSTSVACSFSPTTRFFARNGVPVFLYSSASVTRCSAGCSPCAPSDAADVLAVHHDLAERDVRRARAACGCS